MTTTATTARAAIDAAKLAARLKETIIGQDAAIDALAAELELRSRERRPGRPLAVVLLCGSPGVGKTMLAKRLGEALHDDGAGLTMICGPELKAFFHGLLLGALPGYRGADSTLGRALSRTPRPVILLDEVHHLNKDTSDRLAAMWRDGTALDEHSGRGNALEEAIFVLTTDAGSLELASITESGFRSDDEVETEARKILATSYAGLPAGLLAAIDRVLVLRPLRGIDIARVVALQIERLAKDYGLMVADGGIDRQMLHDVVQNLTGYSAKGGVREIARRLEDRIADGLIEAKVAGATVVRFEGVQGQLAVVPIDAMPVRRAD